MNGQEAFHGPVTALQCAVSFFLLSLTFFLLQDPSSIVLLFLVIWFRKGRIKMTQYTISSCNGKKILPAEIGCGSSYCSLKI